MLTTETGPLQDAKGWRGAEENGDRLHDVEWVYEDKPRVVTKHGSRQDASARHEGFSRSVSGSP